MLEEENKMTLRDFRKVFFGDNLFVVTKLAYFKKSKKYFSFMTVVNDAHITDNMEFTDDILNLEVRSIGIDGGGKVWVDVIEWIEDDKYEALGR